MVAWWSTQRGAVSAGWFIVAIACGGGGGDIVDPPAAVASVSVTLASAQIFIGQSSQGTAVLRDAANNVLTGRTINWTSSNTAVASVSQTGLVTGLTAGTASITASSEGRTGQADITVSVDPATQPQISNITVMQNGQAANLTNVAGSLDLSFRLQVPAGYSGTLVVRMDTVEFLRETVSAAAISSRLMGATDASAVTVTLERSVSIETSRTAFSLSSDRISELPFVTNGNRRAVMELLPTIPGGLSDQEFVDVSTNNPVHFHGMYRFEELPVIIDGKPITGGEGLGAVIAAAYGQEQIQEVQVALVPASAVYGHGAPALGVIHQITRSDLNFFTIDEIPVERENVTMVLTRVKINGVDVFPQVDYVGNTAYTTDLTGSGFANTAAQVQGLTPPAGKNFLVVTQPPVNLLSATAPVTGRATLEPFHLDNLGPQQNSTGSGAVFSLLDRMMTVGGAAYWDGLGLGSNQNQLSSRYDFEDGFHPEQLTDLTGIDHSLTAYYAGPISDIANLYSPQYRVGTSLSLGESSGSRPYTAGALVYDRRGNYSTFPLRTSQRNAWNIQGQLSLGASIGVDQAAFGFSTTRANLGLTVTMPEESTWNLTSIDPSACWVWNVTGSTVGIPNGFLSARGKLNGMWGLGSGPERDGYQILASSGGATGGTATAFLSTLVADVRADVPGQQGFYKFQFKASDNAGRYIGNDEYPKTYRFLWDFLGPTNPLITYDSPIVPGDPVTATLSGMDNYAIRHAFVGVRFNFASALFNGGFAYVPVGKIPVPGTLGGDVTTSLSMQITSNFPVGFWFFQPGTGVIDWGNFHRSNGGMLQLRDMAWNLSPVHFAGFTNPSPVPALDHVSDVRASIGTTNWCPGTCISGGNKMVNLNFNYFDDRPTGEPTISKSAWFGIPTGGNGTVYPLGEGTTVQETAEGGGRRISYNLSLDLSGYCGPSGNMEVFPIGWGRDRKSMLKAGQFFPVTVRMPTRYTNLCNRPAF
jgi:hypothetical protein